MCVCVCVCVWVCVCIHTYISIYTYIKHTHSHIYYSRVQFLSTVIVNCASLEIHSFSFYYRLLAVWLSCLYFVVHCSIAQSCPILCDPRLLCPSPSPGACSNSYPLSQWHHPIILSSAIPFSSCLQSVPASGSFLMSWLFSSGMFCTHYMLLK